MKNDAKIIDFFNKPIRKVLYKNYSVTILTMFKRLKLGKQIKINTFNSHSKLFSTHLKQAILIMVTISFLYKKNFSLASMAGG